MAYEHIRGISSDASGGSGGPLMASQVIPPSLMADTLPLPTTMSTLGTNDGEANGDVSDSGDPIQTTHQVGGGTLRVSWGGVALLGLAGGFFWWFWKRFLPAMEAAGRREQEGSV